MARRNGRKKKIEPSPMTLSFFKNVAAGATENLTIDLSQCASLVGRRFYRQGVMWAVSGVKVLSSSAATPVANVTLQKLPHSWVFSNSWEKCFRAWQKMNNDALEETESIKPKFLDFKIYMDDVHHLAGYQGNLLPLSSAGAYTAGEWESSKFVFPSSPSTNAVASVEVIGVGASYPGASPVTTLDAVSLIEGYAASRGLPNIADPNTPGDADDVGPTATPENWLGSLFTEGTEQDGTVLNDMQTENNIAPYPFENDGVNTDTMYPNGANQGTGLEIHDAEYITGTTVGGTSLFKGGMFPCGLMRFNVQNLDDDNSLALTLLVDLVPGDHRGYLCAPMTEM